MPEKTKNPDSDQQPPEEARTLREPIRIVRRSIQCPDGTTVEVDVPVYPPFRFGIDEIESPALKPPGRKRLSISSKSVEKPHASETGKADEAKVEKAAKAWAKKTPAKPGSRLGKSRSRGEKASG